MNHPTRRPMPEWYKRLVEKRQRQATAAGWEIVRARINGYPRLFTHPHRLRNELVTQITYVTGTGCSSCGRASWSSVMGDPKIKRCRGCGRISPVKS